MRPPDWGLEVFLSTLLIKNARYIVSCDDTDRLYERSNLFIRDNAIEYINFDTLGKIFHASTE